MYTEALEYHLRCLYLIAAGIDYVAAPMLLELGNGKAEFSGTAFGEGKLSMSDYLRITMRQAQSESLPDG